MEQARYDGLMPAADHPEPPVNVATRLAHIAARMPEALAVVNETGGRRWTGPRDEAARICFAQLDRDATAIARGLVEMGVTPGTRLALLVPPGVPFVKLVFGLLRCGATTVLIDPGMGRRHLVDCLAAMKPRGFVAVSPAQAMRRLLRHRFPQARHNVTVGRRWFWGGPTLRQLIARGAHSKIPLPATQADDPAAIIYTSGSTGPPKGVLYTHRMFDTQASQIRQQYSIEPGGMDLACFALFGLFNSVMGVTTVFPDMDFSHPATADPRKLLAAAQRWKITQAFASPAVWDNLSRYCEQHGQQIPSLRKVLSCGAPVPADVLRRTLACVHPEAEMHTPYGATECLPVATIGASEVLAETATQTGQGEGVCVGHKFPCGDWSVIRITDAPILTLDQAEVLAPGQVGELIVRGPQVSPDYIETEPNAMRPNAMAKIRAGQETWHRMGDVGYLDNRQRFWYCGRKAHRVEMAASTLFSVCCEAIFNQHRQVRRSALVGIGCPGGQTPVLVVETESAWQASHRAAGKRSRPNPQAWQRLLGELRELGRKHQPTRAIRRFLWHPSLPVDVRHNAKIHREKLAEWAAEELKASE